jgi:hypothetical protein
MVEGHAALIRRARFIWLTRVAAGPIYSLCVLLVAWAEGDRIMGWRGFLSKEIPVSNPAVAVGFGLLTLAFIAASRALTRPLRTGWAIRPSSREEAPEARFGGFLRRQLIFAGVCELPLIVSLVLALLFGTVVTLWVVSAEHALLMAYYMPRRSKMQRILADVGSLDTEVGRVDPELK